jgi:hypothetical protein
MPYPSNAINEQIANISRHWEYFQKTRELLPLMEVLEAKDSRREERVTLSECTSD